MKADETRDETMSREERGVLTILMRIYLLSGVHLSNMCPAVQQITRGLMVKQ